MADVCDVAGAVSELHLKNSLSKQANSGDEEAPEFDEQGNRICIDCEVIIPPLRVEAVDAVRCVDCQEYEEKRRSMHA